MMEIAVLSLLTPSTLHPCTSAFQIATFSYLRIEYYNTRSRNLGTRADDLGPFEFADPGQPSVFWLCPSGQSLAGLWVAVLPIPTGGRYTYGERTGYDPFPPPRRYDFGVGRSSFFQRFATGTQFRMVFNFRTFIFLERNYGIRLPTRIFISLMWLCTFSQAPLVKSL